MRLSFLAALMLCLAGSAFAENAAAPAETPPPAVTSNRPAIIFESGADKTDKSFVDMARKGALLAKSELRIMYDEYNLGENENREALLKSIAETGTPHIIAVGFENVVPVLKLADAYPQTKFTVIDGMVPPVFSNVRSVIFKDNEGGFMVGMIAAMASKTGTVGFVGGMDVPLIRNFAYGYEQGAKYIKPDITIVRNMIGTTRAAWSNPARGSALAEEQFNSGADVIFACAGGSGLGVLSAAHKNKKFAIGVDTNQNGLYPGFVLTSLVKRVDKAVYESLKAERENTWEPGIRYMGISDAALDYAVDVHNRSLITKEMIEKVEAAKDMIVRGLLEVQVYNPN